MEATLRVGDVVLAEKVSVKLQLPLEVEDLVLFAPPPALLETVEAAGGKLGSRDLFVKRVAAVGGDTVELLPTGEVSVNGRRRPRPPLACDGTAESASPEGVGRTDATPVTRQIPAGSVFVLGDCAPRSTDSRTWGPLPVEKVVARPVVRIWPVDRQGAIVEEADLNPFRRVFEQSDRGNKNF